MTKRQKRTKQKPKQKRKRQHHAAARPAGAEPELQRPVLPVRRLPDLGPAVRELLRQAEAAAQAVGQTLQPNATARDAAARTNRRSNHKD